METPDAKREPVGDVSAPTKALALSGADKGIQGTEGSLWMDGGPPLESC